MNKTGVVVAANGGAQDRRRSRGGGRRWHWRGARRAVAPEHEELARLVREGGGYDLVEVGYDHGRVPTIEAAVETVIGRGASRVVVVATGIADSGLAEVVSGLQHRHRDVEIVYARHPVDTPGWADGIVERIREHDPGQVSGESVFGIMRLGALKMGETAVVHDFDAGHTLLGRLAALGFTPGAQVKMVQNFGHGPVIVNVRDTRIALGRGEASKIRVRQVSCGE
jgi:ferrous iron transport protein A